MEKFRGQDAVIEVDQSGTTIPVGIIDDPEVRVTKNIEELFGAGPITWQDLMQTEVRVEVSGRIAEWDLDTWKTFVGYDEVADAIDDTADVPTWTTTVIYEDTSGSSADFPVQECYTDDLPLGGSKDEWIGMDLNFTGKTIEDVSDQSDTTGA